MNLDEQILTWKNNCWLNPRLNQNTSTLPKGKVKVDDVCLNENVKSLEHKLSLLERK